MNRTRLRLKKQRVPLAYLVVRAFAFSVVALFLIVHLAELQAAEPRIRPALIGNGPSALINLIDTKKLMEKGQRDGLLMFTCYVGASGIVGDYLIYRETPGSELLKKGVGDSLRACRFIPAIYNGTRTDVLLAGTVVFWVADGRPHLRIYMNQNRDDVAKGNDFVAPQVVYNTVDWAALQYDPVLTKAKVYLQNGVLQLSVTVDTNGNQKDLKVVLEDPPGFRFGEGFRKIYARAKWIPGFRNGHPADCTFDYVIYFKLWDRGFERR
jgi:hypothetical protein